MRRAENRWTTGQGHVDGVRGETLLEIFGHERGVPGTPGCRELGLECVATPTGDRSLISREGSQTAQNECQLPLGTEKSPLPGNYLVERRRRLEFNHRPRADVVDRLLRCHATTCPTLPVSGHEKTPRQGRGVSTRYHPASPACRRAQTCPLTMGLGTTTRRTQRVHRPAREGTSPPRHPGGSQSRPPSLSGAPAGTRLRQRHLSRCCGPVYQGLPGDHQNVSDGHPILRRCADTARTWKRTLPD